jgi:hypothetical protein
MRTLNNPIAFTDPDGRIPWGMVGGGASVALCEIVAGETSDETRIVVLALCISAQGAAGAGLIAAGNPAGYILLVSAGYELRQLLEETKRLEEERKKEEQEKAKKADEEKKRNPDEPPPPDPGPEEPDDPPLPPDPGPEEPKDTKGGHILGR